MQANGFKWCAEAVNAEGWNEGDPHAQLLVGGDWPRGCICLAPCWDEEMQVWVTSPPGAMDPGYSEYTEFVDAIRNEVLEKCNDVSNTEAYDYDNCVSASQNAVVFRNANGSEADCTYEISENDTGGGEPCPSAASNPEDYITCSSQGNCDIESSLVAGLMEAPEYGLGEAGYATFVTSPAAGLKLHDVASTDVIYLLGFRTDDIVTEINGYTVRNLDETSAALLALQDETSITVELQRSGNGLTYSFGIQ